MTRATAVQMVEDLTAAGASVSVSQTGADEWEVTAYRSGGVTAAQISQVATKYSVTGISVGAKFT